MAATLPARRYQHDTPTGSSRRVVRSTRHTPPRPAPRPHLRLVQRAPRLAINAALVLVGLVVSLMLATVVLHTRLAERQLEIDRIESAVVEARARFDVLRQQRAELRSPSRLAVAGAELGMIPNTAAEFLPVDPATVTGVLVAAGPVDDELGTIDDAFEPLEQIRRVKAAAED